MVPRAVYTPNMEYFYPKATEKPVFPTEQLRQDLERRFAACLPQPAPFDLTQGGGFVVTPSSETGVRVDYHREEGGPKNDTEHVYQLPGGWEGADLSGMDLAGELFYGANMRGANLRGTKLGGTDGMRRANMLRADLSQADLREADLSRLMLYRAKLVGADLRGADLEGAVLEKADLTGANLAGANLHRADLAGATITGKELVGYVKAGGKLGTTNLDLKPLIGAAGIFMREGMAYIALKVMHGTNGPSNHGRNA
jgi:uncharacterized protein YjbI with pentapeptide repeats